MPTLMDRFVFTRSRDVHCYRAQLQGSALQDCREYHADKGLQETQGWSTGLIHTGSSIGRADQGSMLLVQNIVQGL